MTRQDVARFSDRQCPVDFQLDGSRPAFVRSSLARWPHNAAAISRTTLIGALTETNAGVRPRKQWRRSRRIRRKELVKNIKDRARTQVFTATITMETALHIQLLP